jgi:hypothetical protein
LDVRNRRRDFNETTLFEITAKRIVKKQAYFCKLAEITGLNPFDCIRTHIHRSKIYPDNEHARLISQQLAGASDPQELLRFEQRVRDAEQPAADAAAEQRCEQHVPGEHSKGGQARDEERHRFVVRDDQAVSAFADDRLQGLCQQGNVRSVRLLQFRAQLCRAAHSRHSQHELQQAQTQPHRPIFAQFAVSFTLIISTEAPELRQ